MARKRRGLSPEEWARIEARWAEADRVWEEYHARERAKADARERAEEEERRRRERRRRLLPFL